MNNVNSKAKELYEIMATFRKNPYNLTYDGTVLTQQLQIFVEKQIPIKLIIPACHGKSREKICVFDKLPDLGEYLGIQNFANLCLALQEHYAPGVILDIIHEGYFYILTPFVQQDAEIESYMKIIKEMLEPYPFINSIELSNFFPELSDNEARREKFLQIYAPDDNTVDQLINTSSSINNLYINYQKIYKLYYKDILQDADCSNKLFIKKCKQHARFQLKIYLGFGKLVKKHYESEHYIRLSTLYKSPDFVDQLSINYLANHHHIATPSFNCVVQTAPGYYEMIKYSEGVKRGLQIKEHKGFKYFAAA